ncbi:MAG: SDR family oxidoreductase, partial [Deltaproteobacteria bacterium]|nr:SDR family oxidoreductase [Deltaproteobacteria bacterium]
MRLKNKVAMITGAGRGIGLATALKFAGEGALLVLIDLDLETLTQASAMVADMGQEAIQFHADITAEYDVTNLVAAAESHFGRVDILVNNAGFDRPGTSKRIDAKDLGAVLGVHVIGPFLLARSVVPGMVARKYGRIINVSSVYGKIGGKGELAYSTAKAGMLGFTKSLAKELGKYAVTVN